MSFNISNVPNNNYIDVDWIDSLNAEPFIGLLPSEELQVSSSDHTDFNDSFQKIILTGDLLLDSNKNTERCPVTETFVAKYSSDNVNFEKEANGKLKFSFAEDKWRMKINGDYLKLLQEQKFVSFSPRMYIQRTTIFFVVGQILDKHIKNKDQFPNLDEFVAELIYIKNKCIKISKIVQRITSIAQNSIQGKNLSQAEVTNLQDILQCSTHFKDCVLVKE